VEIWENKNKAVWWAGKNIPAKFCDCFAHFQTCVWLSVVVMMKAYFSNILVRQQQVGY
jgi:hypothetical protein